ncbi:putative Histidine kinase [metagenome]|uniref:histidine kinase n=1 Tax=metagenome TaxID=256318 RepID=A0A2P2C7H2_9ZZZZ
MNPAASYRRSTRREAVVVVGLVLFVLGAYVLIVVGGGALIGRSESPSPALSVLATTVVALAFAPVQATLERALRGRATPYDVLARFADTADGEDAAEDVAGRMSRLLAQGTGAQWAQVWLQVDDSLSLAGRWPSDADDERTPPVTAESSAAGIMRSLPVRHGDRLLGVLRLQGRPGLPLTSVEERLFVGLAAQAGLVLRLAGLRVRLEDRHRALEARTQELESSRGRLIEAQDAERSRLERDIHDGAQQHLVALAVNLRLVQVIAVRSPGRAHQVLVEQVAAAGLAIETLSLLSRGIYPQTLSEQGLVAALLAGVGGGPIPVTTETGAGLVGRPTPVLEAALYFCCMEAIQNAAKHSGATGVTVRFRRDASRWCLDVTDDGSGFDEKRALEHKAGVGLMNMRDRLDAVGGTLDITSRVGLGTTVRAMGPRDEVG